MILCSSCLRYKSFLLISVLLYTVCNLYGQTFEYKLLAGTEDMLGSVPRWADFDNDGDYDVLLSGTATSFAASSKVYRHDTARFTFIDNAPSLGSGRSAAWGDFNNDGMLELTGSDGSEYNHFMHFHLSINNGCEFVPRPTKQLTLLNGVNVWKDFDHDGDMDVLCQENTLERNYQTKIYLMEDNDFVQTALIPTQLLYVEGLQWEDFDKDGDLDIFMRVYLPGHTSLNDQVIEIYENKGGSYHRIDLFAMPFFVFWAGWADIEGDGDLDIILTGNDRTDAALYQGMSVYANEQGKFTRVFFDYRQIINIDAEYFDGDAGDIDNDGDLDIIVFAADDNEHKSLKVYRNTNGNFRIDYTLEIPREIFHSAGVNFIDYDHDGDMDISFGRGVFVNTLNTATTPPTVPTGLLAVVSGKGVSLSWQPATDGQSPATAISYNVHVTTGVQSIWQLNGLSHLSSGNRCVPQIGNAGLLTSKQLQNLPDGTYYWSVQAIDQNLQGSAYAPFQSFTIDNGNIQTATIQITDVPVLYNCECNPMGVAIETTGSFGEDNQFWIELSDSTGSFAHPTKIYNGVAGEYGQVSDGTHAGVVSGFLPSSVKAGTHYRVRVVSSFPAIISADNGYDIALRKQPQLPGLISAVGSSQKLCINAPNTKLSIPPIQYANTYTWHMEPAAAGSILGQGRQVEVDWQHNYTGEVRIWVEGHNGCGTGPASLAIEFTILPMPQVADYLEGVEQVCPGRKGVLFSASIIEHASRYKWLLPAGAGFSARNETTDSSAVYVDFADDFLGGNIAVAGIGECGTGPYKKLKIDLQKKPGQAGTIFGPSIVCTGGSLFTFRVDPVKNATGYEWHLPEGMLVASGSTLTATSSISVQLADRAFTGIISVAGINDCGAGEVSPDFIFSSQLTPATPGALQGQDTICPGSLDLLYTLAKVSGAEKYQWSLPKGMESMNDSTFTFSNFIKVRVDKDFSGGVLQVAAVNFCGTSAASSLLVRIHPTIHPPLIMKVCNTLQVAASANPVQWYINDMPIANGTSQEITITDKGEYSVEVTGPCYSVESTLHAAPLILSAEDMANVFTPNGDGANETFEVVEKLLGAELTVYNRWGKRVYHSANYHNTWNGDTLPTGVYYYQLNLGCLPKPLRSITEMALQG